jgi:TRAP-type C4-dicarboxylate transport system permease small subunit
MSFLQRTILFLHKTEDYTLAAIFLLMLALSVLQIVARNVGFVSFVWGDELIRLLVLWVGLLGAMAAARSDKHLRIDLLTRLVSPAIRRWLVFFTQVGTAAVSGVAAQASVYYIGMEYADGMDAFAQVPVWVCMLIIPFSLGVIALRYGLLACRTLFCHEGAAG